MIFNQWPSSGGLFIIEVLKMTEHVLYKPSDFSYDDESYLSDIVINGGLSVCKHCGAYESGLDEYPTCEEWRNRVED